MSALVDVCLKRKLTIFPKNSILKMDEKNLLGSYLLPGSSHENTPEGGYQYVLINNLHTLQLFDCCRQACRSNGGVYFCLSNFHRLAFTLPTCSYTPEYIGYSH